MKSQKMRYLLLALFVALTAGMMMAQEYSKDYQAIERLANDGKYRSALEAATELYERAATADAPDHMLRALAYRAAYTFRLEEDGFAETIGLLRGELATAADRPVVAPVLHLLIGKGYQQYGQRNSWRLRDATAVTTDTLPGATVPLEEWTLEQLGAGARQHALRALALAREQRTPLAEVPAIVSDPEAAALRPTLYDLLALEALDVLGSPLVGLDRPLPGKADYLLVPAPEFTQLQLASLEADHAGTYGRLRIYQDLLSFHLPEPSAALLLYDLERVRYAREIGAEDKDYLAALDRMYRTYADVPLRDLLLVEKARLYHRTDTSLGPLPRARALEILESIGDKSPRVRREAEELRRQLTMPSLRINTQEAYGREANLLINLHYKNTDRVYHRVVRAPDGAENINTYYLDPKELARWRRLPAVAQADFRLPANDDYSEHRTETWLEALPAGQYLLLTSSGASFDPDQEYVAANFFQVSDLALMEYNDGEEESYLKVLDRTTGAPRAGVRVTVRQRNNRRNDAWKTSQTATTGADGRLPTVQADRVQIQYVLADPRTDDRYVSDVRYAYRNRRGPNSDRITPSTPLFTDRSIYRPGQTVHVYGVTLQKLTDEMPELLTDESRTLTLLDVNGQEMGKADVRSDGYSRFAHSFRLPEGGLTGNYLIQTEGGSVRFRVEEYKRPRFRVELDAPDYVLSGELATVKGKALLYAGPGLNDARVNYRVFLEEVRYWWWGRGNGGNERELVADGEASTDGDGEFVIAFTPAAGLGSARTRYRYVIEADVADATGETHAAEASVGLRSEKPVISLQPAAEVVDVADSLGIRAAGTEEDLTVSYRLVRVEKPDAALKERRWGFPDRPLLDPADYRRHFPRLAAAPSAPLGAWERLGDPAATGTLAVRGGKGATKIDLAGFRAGYYRLEWSYPDGTSGSPALVKVVNTATAELPAGMLYHFSGLEQNVTVGEPLEIVLISALDLPHVEYGWASRKGSTSETAGGGKRVVFRYRPGEADRGGIFFDATFLRLNEAHSARQRFALGWDNKQLQIDYATFRDKLRPGTPERWTLTVRNADGSPVAAAALATMYDASLDQIYPGRPWSLQPYPAFNAYRNFGRLLGAGVTTGYGRTEREWPALPETKPFPSLDLGPFPLFGNGREKMAMMARSTMNASIPQAYGAVEEITEEMEVLSEDGGAPPPPPPPSPTAGDLAETVSVGYGETSQAEPPVEIRKNLQETAFWLPELTSNAAGELIVGFDSPEALTSWKLRVLAHDKDLNTAVSTRTVVTQKELIVLPNVPRFVREGDALGLTARVNNLTDAAMAVTVSLEFFDPATNAPLALGAAAGAGQRTREQSLDAQSGQAFSFPLEIPDGLAGTGPIGYRIVARAAGFSDGEENVIPVLTDRTLITVSQAFYLKRKEKKTVTLPLLADYDSETLRHVGYTFEATTNPAWLALKALPYLMEYPYDCTEQLANRYFANQLAYATVSGKPVLEQVFRRWQADTNALKSELERNPTLKNALLTETPWLRAAQSEAEQRARIGELFDLKALAEEQVATLEKLAVRQDDSGYFSWFPGGRENRYMTQYVVETLSRLRELGVVTPDQRARVAGISRAAILWLDRELKEDYAKLLRRMKDEKDWRKDYRPSSMVVHYLYARSRANPDLTEDEELDAALAFYRERTQARWLDYDLYEQALLAVTYATPQQAARPQSGITAKIIASLRERAIRKDEFGMYWKYGQGYRWQNLPIETHCRILEAFRVAGGTTEELDEMRLWLLTNKRTNRWPTTKATAAAVYALLNTGTDWTRTDGKPLQVKWRGLDKDADLGTRVRAAQESPEAATGAFSVSAQPAEVSSALASVEVRNRENELVWGGVYWQYTELAQKVEASSDGPLSLERELFRRIPTDDGMRLEPITADQPLRAGDRVSVRLILRSDRDLDFVHLKDRRAATFEPVEQLSGYQYEGGLGYYFAPGDLATNFFIDHLPRGTYTLEYDLFTTYSGSFSNGLGRVQCMYAPEFGGNTAGARIVVE